MIPIDLRVLRWCLIPAALLVCVTVALWQLSTHEIAPVAPHRVSVSSSAAITGMTAVSSRAAARLSA